jgi:hypothetical protein
MKYLLDSNIYMDCYDRYYVRECFPTFWEKFTPLLNQYALAADVMLNEHQHDEWFLHWFNVNYHGTILNHTDYVTDWSEVLEHVRTCGNYRMEALAGDKGWAHESIADPWLIAMARHERCTLVTSEVSDVNIRLRGHMSRNAKIPDVAEDLHIKTLDRNEFFRIVGLTV